MEEWLQKLHNRPKIKSLEITVKVGCKLLCSWCPQRKLIRAYKGSLKRELDIADYYNILKKLPQDIEIHFSGMSEPTEHLHWLVMVTEALISGRKTSLFTTLSGATHFECRILNELEFEDLVIHLPNDRGDERLVASYEFFDKLAVLVEGPRKAKNFWFSCDGIPPETVLEMTGEIPPSYKVNRAGNLAYEEQEPRMGPIECAGAGRALNNNVMLPDGRVLLCCNDYGVQHVLGNILTDSYESLENEREKIRAELDCMSSETLCRHCHLAVPKQES